MWGMVFLVLHKIKPKNHRIKTKTNLALLFKIMKSML